MDKGKTGLNNKTNLPFARAYDLILTMSHLTAPEKIMLIAISRYWPNPCWESNLNLANSIMCSERNAEKLIKKLEDKHVIKRGYAHRTKNGKFNTFRVIKPMCFPEKCSINIKWAKPEHMDGQQTEQMDGDRPNNSSFLPEQSDDLLEKNREINRKATLTPMPAVWQAPALQKKWKPMPNKEFKLEKKKQVEKLREDELRQTGS